MEPGLCRRLCPSQGAQPCWLGAPGRQGCVRLVTHEQRRSEPPGQSGRAKKQRPDLEAGRPSRGWGRGGDGLEGSLLTFRKGEGGLAVPEVWSPGFRHRQDTCPHTPDTPLAERETHQSPERLDAVHRGGGRTRGQTPPDPREPFSRLTPALHISWLSPDKRVK